MRIWVLLSSKHYSKYNPAKFNDETLGKLGKSVKFVQNDHWRRSSVSIVDFKHVFVCREAYLLTYRLVCTSCDDKSIYKLNIYLVLTCTFLVYVVIDPPSATNFIKHGVVITRHFKETFHEINLFQVLVYCTEAYSESCQTSKMERFAKIVNSFKPLTIFAKCPILGDWQSSECASLTHSDAEVYLRPYQTSMIDFFTEICNS